MSKFEEFRKRSKANSNRIWAWIIGIGLILFAIHNPNQPLLEYAFLPIIGLAMSLMAVFFVLSDNWRKLDYGSKWLWIPLVCIGGSIAVSGFVNGGGWGAKVSPLFFACYLFGVYLAGRILKDDLFAPFSFAVIFATIGCVVYGIWHPGQMTGGFVSPTNYDIAAGLMIIGVVVGILKWRWWLSAVALIGLFFCGAPEGLFGIGVLLMVILIRRDWGRRILLPVGLVVLAVTAWFGAGYGQSLYSHAVDIVTSTAGIDNPNSAFEPGGQNSITGRWVKIKEAMSDIKPFGHEYNITHFTNETVHNVPLVVVQQVGVLAGVAWLFVTVYCLIKSKWKYAWVAVMALCVFDHYIWTQVAPWFWALVGVSTASAVKSDLIFKETGNVKVVE